MSDSISRQDAVNTIKRYKHRLEGKGQTYGCLLEEFEHQIPSAEVKTVDCTDFIRWLTETVMDDGMWELNAVAYGEVIARKLTKLGVLKVKDGYYIRHIENNTKESDLVYRSSAEAEDRLYIRIYADDEPSVKAEKLYQICGETQNREVTKWLKEYFPSAEAVRGEWIKTADGNGWNEWWVFKCSICGATIEDKQYRSWEYNFCPNCGARMILQGGDKQDDRICKERTRKDRA